jgi:hypothetical protein
MEPSKPDPAAGSAKSTAIVAKQAKRPRLLADEDSDEDDGLGAMPPPTAPVMPNIRIQMDGLNMEVIRPGPPAGNAAAAHENVSLAAITNRMGLAQAFCWGCEHLHKPNRRDKYPEIWALLAFVTRNLHSMSMQQFSVHLSEMHLDRVWRPRDRDGLSGEDNPKWPANVIRAHFQVHDNNPRTVHMRQISTHSMLEKYLQTRIAKKNQDTQVEEPNLEVIKMLNAVSVHLHRLNTTDMDKIGLF